MNGPDSQHPESVGPNERSFFENGFKLPEIELNDKAEKKPRRAKRAVCPEAAELLEFD